MSYPVIVSAARTAIGSFNGSLSSIPASSLGSTAIKAVIQRANLQPDSISEVVMGQVLQAGCGQNPARQALIGAGIPETVPALTVNKVCGSGLKTVMMAAESVIANEFFNTKKENRIIVAGGQENMSLAPRLMLNSRTGNKMGDIVLKDSMIMDGLWCAFNDYHMGITAENIVDKYKITREAQDEFSLASQVKANEAIKAGKFKNEVIPVELKDRKGNVTSFVADEFVKENPDLSQFTKLKAAFKKNGTVTAGSASGINDGAAAVIVTSKRVADAMKLPILAKIVSFSSAGVDPKIMGLGVTPAVNKCLSQAGWNINKDLDLIEFNEAFAAQSLGVMHELGLSEETKKKVNVNGGAIALGHPIGASGTRILVTLLHELKRSGKKKGLAALCIGGGQGVAMAVEAV